MSEENESQRILRERAEDLARKLKMSDEMGKKLHEQALIQSGAAAPEAPAPPVEEPKPEPEKEPEEEEHGKEVDSGSNQASGSPAPGPGSSAGSEDTPSQDGEGPALIQPADKKESQPRPDPKPHAPLKKPEEKHGVKLHPKPEVKPHQSQNQSPKPPLRGGKKK